MCRRKAPQLLHMTGVMHLRGICTGSSRIDTLRMYLHNTASPAASRCQSSVGHVNDSTLRVDFGTDSRLLQSVKVRISLVGLERAPMGTCTDAS